MFIKRSVNCVALLFAVLVFSIPAMAESSWFWQHPYPTGSSINGIHFIDNDNGWIVTFQGAIYGTDDGGTTWEELYRGSKILRRVFFLNTSRGWICGNDGFIIRTANGGDNWSISYPAAQHFKAIEFTDENYGTVVGTCGTILRTMNGGNSWQTQGSGITSHIQDVSFISSTTGWTTGNTGKLLHTVTAGAFWVEKNTGTPVGYDGIHFIDDSCGFAVGDSLVVFTGDGGNIWSVVYSLLYEYFSDVDFNVNLGAVSGRYGVAVTENAGEQWVYETMPSEFELPTYTGLKSVSVPSDTRVFTAGLYGLMYFRNSAGDWSQLSTHQTLENMNAVVHFGENRIWACGDNGVIMRSSDGGVNWESQIIDDDFSLRDICFQTTLLGYCVGNSSSSGVILKTVNGGTNWTEITPAVPTVGFMSVDFMNEDCGVAVGLYSEIIYTTDGGVSWTEKTGFGSVSLSSVCFGDTDRGWAVGSSGKIICFDFNSDSWSEQTSSMTHTFHGLFALNADTVWAVGWNGTIVQTQNNGCTWETVAVTGNDYRDVWFAENGLDGYLTGYSNANFGTTSNGGNTVSHSPYGPENLLERISFIDVNNGWGCGDYGMILRFGEDPTGIAEFSHSLSSTPQTGILTSPNPFTASSAVSFTLPGECFVAMDLYDLAGRKVQTIHSGILPGGEHNLTVTGADLAPGLYFLRLTAGGMSETRTVVRIP
ncbi:MAG: T9SS type A sorting domain-containing protein [Candidatus Sabulitectum sp.]|nr:T9SS type A sorting domain-containing protein [Candidatus Sabulitectum sp.]